jgi:hypothetical protein
MALVLDTGPLLAALDAADPDHAASAELLTEAREDLVVPVLVLAEVDCWCHERLGPRVWLGFLEDLLRGAYRLEPLAAADLRRCHELQSVYAISGSASSTRACWRWSSGSARRRWRRSTAGTSASCDRRTSAACGSSLSRRARAA